MPTSANPGDLIERPHRIPHVAAHLAQVFGRYADRDVDDQPDQPEYSVLSRDFFDDILAELRHFTAIDHLELVRKRFRQSPVDS